LPPPAARSFSALFAPDLSVSKLTREAAASAAEVNVPITNASAFSQLRFASAAKTEAAAALQSEEADLSVAQHKVQQDEALYARAERDRARYQALVEKYEIARSEYDARETEARSAQEALESDRAAVISAQKEDSRGTKPFGAEAG
jgi:membrane fusion protein (multidrug efflux system)